MKTVEKKLQDALDIIDQIDTHKQPWEEVDEALQRIEGELQEARKGLMHSAARNKYRCPNCDSKEFYASGIVNGGFVGSTTVLENGELCFEPERVGRIRSVELWVPVSCCECDRVANNEKGVLS